MHSFEDWGFELFLQIWLEMPIHPPKFRIFAVPLNVIGHHRDPQKAHPWPELRLHADFGGDHASCGAIRARAEETKKRKRKARKETYCGKLGDRPDHPHNAGGLGENLVLHAGWSAGDRPSFKLQVEIG